MGAEVIECPDVSGGALVSSGISWGAWWVLGWCSGACADDQVGWGALGCPRMLGGALVLCALECSGVFGGLLGVLWGVC